MGWERHGFNEGHQTPYTIIRRALAQSVSDHRPLEKENNQKNLQFLSHISSENTPFSKKGLRNDKFQEKDSEMSDFCFSC